MNLARRHRVHLPGPLTNRLPKVMEHGQECTDDACAVVGGLTAWLAEPGARIPVQGDYFTEDGQTFERCAWQPDRYR